VSDKSWTKSVGMSGGTVHALIHGCLSSCALHAAKWVVVVAIPLTSIWFTEVHSVQGKLQRLGAIVADLPSSVRAHVNYATALQEAGRADEAVSHFTAALHLNPGSSKTHVNLASILIEKGKLNEAQSHFEQALRIEPNNAEYHSGYAYLLEKLGQDEQAAAECEASIRLAPKSAQAHYSYGAFLE